MLDFTDEEGKNYIAGDEWLFEGPGTYIPKKEVDVIENVRASIIGPNQAIKLRARKETQVGSLPTKSTIKTAGQLSGVSSPLG